MRCCVHDGRFSKWRVLIWRGGERPGIVSFSCSCANDEFTKASQWDGEVSGRVGRMGCMHGEQRGEMRKKTARAKVVNCGRVLFLVRGAV